MAVTASPIPTPTQVCHHLDKNIPEDIAFAESRIRGETIAAEDILHDMGAISIMASDSQAMGRVGEVVTRTWQTADKMKMQRGSLPEDSEQNDNLRIKRCIALRAPLAAPAIRPNPEQTAPRLCPHECPRPRPRPRPATSPSTRPTQRLRTVCRI